MLHEHVRYGNSTCSHRYSTLLETVCQLRVSTERLLNQTAGVASVLYSINYTGEMAVLPPVKASLVLPPVGGGFGGQRMNVRSLECPVLSSRPHLKDSASFWVSGGRKMAGKRVLVDGKEKFGARVWAGTAPGAVAGRVADRFRVHGCVMRPIGSSDHPCQMMADRTPRSHGNSSEK